MLRSRRRAPSRRRQDRRQTFTSSLLPVLLPALLAVILLLLVKTVLYSTHTHLILDTAAWLLESFSGASARRSSTSSNIPVCVMVDCTEIDMKAVIQRVKSASVTVDNQLVSTIGRGLLVLAGVGKEDDEKEADNLVGRILKSRLWPDDNGGQWKKNVQDIEGEVLCVSQFTLYAQLKKGNKPDFREAADAETARRLYDYFYQRLREAYNPERVKNGVFRAMMDVDLKNDGPVGLDYRSDQEAVTIEINTKQPKKEKKPEGDGDGDKGGGQTEGKQSYEFKLPASLLE